MIFRLMLVSMVAMMMACGGGDDALMAEFGCPGNYASVGLDATPAQVVVGAPTDIEIRWELSEFLAPPVTATMIVDSPLNVEVEVPLSEEVGGAGYAYVGTQRNPFGGVLLPGLVSVLASGPASDACRAPATATTSFELR